MHRIFITVLLICSNFIVNAQTVNNNDLIAEGIAKLKVKPDIGTLTLTIDKLDSIETNAIKELNLQTEKLVSVLVKLGFTTDNIRVSDYDVTTSKNDNNKKEYTASDIIKVEFGLDQRILDGFYKEVERNKIQDLSISFDAKLSESLERGTRIKLLQLAIENSKVTAENISKSLKVKISGVKQVLKTSDGSNINDAVNMVKFGYQEPSVSANALSGTVFSKYQIEEIELEEKILITYNISN